MQRYLSKIGALVVAVSLLGGVAGCTDRIPTTVDDPPEPGDTLIIAFNQDLSGWPRDAWDLIDATVTGDSIHLDVGYAGGCQTHQLWLAAVDRFQSLPDQGITPTVAVPLFLAHDANGDACEAYVNRSATFALAPLHNAYRDTYGDVTARIILRIPQGQGSTDTTALDYTFQ